ncbi:hypothetical protein D3C74_348160 [compost metagenome]
MTYPILRRSATGSPCVMSSPRSRMRPAEGSTSRFVMRSVVDFPQPDGPTSASISCSRTLSERSPTATVPLGYSLRTPSNTMAASSVMVGNAAVASLVPVVELAMPRRYRAPHVVARAVGGSG